MFAVRENNARKSNLVHRLDGVADHGIRVMAHLAVRNDVIRPNKVQIVDICTRNEFVDIDRPGRLQRDVVEFVFSDLDIAVVVDLVALHNIFVVDFFAGVDINLQVFDAMAGLAIDLVKADLFAVRCRWKQRNRTCDQRKAQEALPICTRGHDKYSNTQHTTGWSAKPNGTTNLFNETCADSLQG